MKKSIIIGVTCGDINGVGLQILIQSLPDFCKKNKKVIPVVFTSEGSWDFYVKFLRKQKIAISNRVNYKIIKDISESRAGFINIFNCLDANLNILPGKVTKQSGLAATQSLYLATQYLISKKIDSIVTMPVDKSNMGFLKPNKFIGHTEYFRDYTGAKESLMILMADNLKVATVTNHLAVADVSRNINKKLLFNKMEILINSLKKDFLIKRPKIAVLGLNPHAGDSGLVGLEEITIIKPVIKKCIQKGDDITGPFSADSFFGKGLFKNYDAVLSMYHDQGLIPFKMQSFNQGVNFTAGMNVVRTSPDHGPAYDIVGTNKVNNNSFINAMFWAEKIYRSRLMKKE